MENAIERNDIWYANLEETKGSVQNGLRPVYIIQNNLGNYYSPTTIVAPITTKINKTPLLTHVKIKNTQESGLSAESIVLCEQLQTLDKNQLINKIGHIENNSIINNVNKAIKVSVNL